MHQILSSLFALFMMITAPVTNVGDIAVCAVSEQVNGENYEFSGNCPRFSGMGNREAEKKLNARMRECFETALFRTKASAAELPTGDRPEQQKAEGIFDYEVKRNSGGIVSLLLNETLHNGNADTAQLKSGVSFFTGSGEIIKLPDLFLNSEEGMKQVNDEISLQMKGRGLESALERANPVVDAGQPFYLTDSALTIIIPETTWFGRNMGTVEFNIPLKPFGGCLKNEFVP